MPSHATYLSVVGFRLSGGVCSADGEAAGRRGATPPRPLALARISRSRFAIRLIARARSCQAPFTSLAPRSVFLAVSAFPESKK